MSSPSLQSLTNVYNLYVSLCLEIEYGTSAYKEDIMQPLIETLESRIAEYDEILKKKGNSNESHKS